MNLIRGLQLFLALIGTIVASAGMVLLVSSVLALLPENLTIPFKIAFGLIFLALGSVIGIFAGKKVLKI